MKYRTIIGKEDITVITEDGGIANIHYAEELDEGDKRKSVTEYYQARFTQEMLDSGADIWEEVGEGNMYYNNWTCEYDDPTLIGDALKWLCVGCDFKEDETIWKDFK